MHIAPSSVIRRQLALGRTGSQNPEDRIDEQAVVLGDTAPHLFALRQMRLQQGPCLIGNIMTAMDGCRVFHAHLLLGSADSLILFYLVTTLSKI